ncbi:hypothetical protein BLNAU_23490 [Blattamonas nauphoetae]|uniref:Uncharacterized protein n=1 Tax=Blattamonas nauphoetae TaxID=2049346 RepID=A0ABQ9WQK0_9EUKA|nr:hypothetical protein BLNAU_23490 [Blattamonas nauphoetae]
MEIQLRQTTDSGLKSSHSCQAIRRSSHSDGPFTESSLLPIQTDVEIVGNGTESVHLTLDELPRPHTTQLTAQLEVEAGANLTLRSMTLVPSTSSSPLVTMNEEGNLFVKNGSSALIVVSELDPHTDTLFLTISRSHTDSVDGSVQSGSCVEGQTSGSISIRFCKFGGCSSNGRAGAIYIVRTDERSRLSMEGCQFEKNKAGTCLNTAERKDSTCLSLGLLPNLLPYSRLSDLTLQFLLGSRLHNNVHTAVIATSLFNETMTPFFLKNASVSVLLHIQCVISVTQPNNESLLPSQYFTFTEVSHFPSSELKNTAFSVDEDSSISLTSVNITFTNKTLLILSSIRQDDPLIWDVTISSGLSLDGVFCAACDQRMMETSLGFALQCPVNGGFAFCPLCNVTILESEFTLLSPAWGVDCEATATDANGAAIGRGGAICVTGTTTAKNPVYMISFAVSSSGSNDAKCRFSIYPCETLDHAFRHLKLFYPDNTIYPRSAHLDANLTMTSISFENENMTLRGGNYLKITSTGAAGTNMFVIKGDSRLTMQSISYVLLPLISYRPTPLQEGGLGSAPFSITNSSFTNLTLVDSSIIVAETSGDVTFQKTNFTAIQNVSEKGVGTAVSKGTTRRASREDTSLAETHKWRTGSIVYWLFSPSEVIVVNASDSNAPWNRPLNSLEVITVSSPSSLEEMMTVNDKREVRSSSTTQQTVTVALDSGDHSQRGDLTFLEWWKYSFCFTVRCGFRISVAELVLAVVVHTGLVSADLSHRWVSVAHGMRVEFD